MNAQGVTPKGSYPDQDLKVCPSTSPANSDLTTRSAPMFRLDHVFGRHPLIILVISLNASPSVAKWLIVSNASSRKCGICIPVRFRALPVHGDFGEKHIPHKRQLRSIH
jgi:hypothetical protein